MKTGTLIARSLRFYWRTHLGVLAGTAVATAVLVGALLVGNSVRYSLRRLALLRLGDTQLALASGGRFFRAKLADEVASQLDATAAPALMLRGTATAADTEAFAPSVQVLGVENRFWRLGGSDDLIASAGEDDLVINERLANELGAEIGDAVVLRIEKPSLMSRDAPLSADAESKVAVRLSIGAVAGDEQFGRFSLQANQVATPTAYLPLSRLQRLVDSPGRANLLLLGGKGKLTLQRAEAALRKCWRLADAQLSLRELPARGAIELRSARIFIERPVASAAAEAYPNAQGVLTYFVNELRVGGRTTPYSMVAAIGPLKAASGALPAPVPAEMSDDRIIINDWLAADLRAEVGDELRMSYFVLKSKRRLETRAARFAIRAAVPLAGAAADATLMPAFPGLAEIENCRDWKPGVPIDLSKIRDIDQRYWREHRGTPKAFVTLPAGQRMWSNRFGNLTAIRFAARGTSLPEIAEAIRRRLEPASMGLFFRGVRAEALAASEQALDFGQLFLALSAFLIAAAVLLTGLLFVFGIQQRSEQIGTLLALGFPPRRVGRLLLAEGGALAIAGAAVGAALGTLYTRATLHGLATVWQEAVAKAAIRYHAEPLSLLTGFAAGAIAAFVAMWLTLRIQTKRPARELLAGTAAAELDLSRKALGFRRLRLYLGIVATVAAGVSLLVAGKDRPTTAFFIAGTLLLIAGLAFCSAILAGLARWQPRRLTLGSLAASNTARRGYRSLAVAGLLACGCFLVVSVGAFRLGGPSDPYRRSAGTGGFAMHATSALPLFGDLDSPAGRSAYGLAEADMEGVTVVAMRLRDGDDASCLNLNRARRPRLLGVPVSELLMRKAFTFVKAAPARGRAKAQNPWALLEASLEDGSIPAVADETTVVWGLGKRLGDTLEFTDERGRPLTLRIVGILANSVFQGSLLISAKQFVRRFPSEEGYRAFLIDAPRQRSRQVLRTLRSALRHEGLEITPTSERLAAFNTVQNTYLAIFQSLGALGLLLGSVGLAVVVLRNVLERRGELALLRAVGFSRGRLRWMVLLEHWGLLVGGLVVGLIAAAVAVLPALRSAGTHVPYMWLSLTLAAVLLSGAGWVLLAAAAALRSPLLDALRNE